MNEYIIESFIDRCDELMIVEEGFFDKFKNRRSSTKSSTNNTKVNENAKYTVKKAVPSDFDHLYKTEAMCAEGMKCDENAYKTLFEHVKGWDGCPNEVHFYYCSGKDLNNYYHLTKDNRYPNDLGIFFLDWSNFTNTSNISQYKGKFRWFSDVVDNNARREIRAKNPYYKNYHSIYGDEWFYSTI